VGSGTPQEGPPKGDVLFVLRFLWKSRVLERSGKTRCRKGPVKGAFIREEAEAAPGEKKFQGFDKTPFHWMGERGKKPPLRGVFELPEYMGRLVTTDRFPAFPPQIREPFPSFQVEVKIPGPEHPGKLQ